MTPGSTTARALTGLGPRQHWFTIGADYARPEGHRVNAAVDDEFESAPNDLVVPAAGCHLPGVPPADSLRIGGSDAHHHNYFANRQVHERLNAWLR
jgi:hypothetical protein